MGMAGVKTFAKTALKFVEKNLPTILSAAALLGLGGSVAMAIKGTPKMEKDIREAKIEAASELGLIDEDVPGIDEEVLKKVKLGVWKWVRLTVKNYWKCGTITIATMACIVGARYLDARKITTLTAMVSSLSTASKAEFERFNNKAKETMGDKKYEEFRHDLGKDILEESAERNVYYTRYGKQLFLLHIGDGLGQDYIFRSRYEDVVEQWKEFRESLRKEHTKSITELLWQFGIDIPDTYITDALVWNYNPLNADELVDIRPIKFDRDPYTQEYRGCIELTIPPIFDRT